MLGNEQGLGHSEPEQGSGRPEEGAADHGDGGDVEELRDEGGYDRAGDGHEKKSKTRSMVVDC